jgi:hypothetical protein
MYLDFANRARHKLELGRLSVRARPKTHPSVLMFIREAGIESQLRSLNAIDTTNS